MTAKPVRTGLWKGRVAGLFSAKPRPGRQSTSRRMRATSSPNSITAIA